MPVILSVSFNDSVTLVRVSSALEKQLNDYSRLAHLAYNGPLSSFMVKRVIDPVDPDNVMAIEIPKIPGEEIIDILFTKAFIDDTQRKDFLAGLKIKI